MQSVSFEQRREIAEFYRLKHDRIMAAGRGWGIDKYSIPHLDSRTPIERMAFDACISEGFALYPEFPVGGFFVDLGNPRLKVGLELDGLEFHQDWVKDSKRDAELWAQHGWKMFRCTGSRCNVVYKRPEGSDVKRMVEWFHNTVDGLIYAMRVVFMDQGEPFFADCCRELERSRIVSDFSIP